MKLLNLLRIHTLCVLLTFSVGKLNAQDTTTTKGLLEYIFQHIDKSQVPTGFLEEYGCPMLPMMTFNGTLTDSNRIDMHLWRTLYFQLQTGYCGSGANPLPAITTVNTSIKQNSGDTVAIPLLIGEYNTVKSNAFTGNLLSYNSSTRQIFDVAGRPQSPYELKKLFAASPDKHVSLTGSETFVIKSNIIWNNTAKTISQLQIDFDNGNGFQTVSIGTPIGVSYVDTGHKRWTIKATLSDNSILQCYSDYYVLEATGSARYTPGGATVPWWGFVAPVAGTHSGATVWVDFSNRNPSGTLRKPLIVVEGYDVSFIAPGLQANYTIRDFINAINEPSTSYDFNQQLDDIAGYDLVFIDFRDGADDIVRNAAVVQEVINRVNANKVNDNRFGNIRQQNVVMGLSMGGLCARYALANMTKNFPGTPTEARLLITHDSPHRGANIPLGLQYMIRMLGGFQIFGTNINNIYPDYNDVVNLLNAPATQQLLLYRSVTANTFATNTFLDATYRPMITFSPAGPQPSYRFVATSNGNECALPMFNPGKTFINLGAGVSAGVYARFLFFRVPIVTYKLAAEMEAYALPNTGSTAKIARLYTINHLQLFGFINIFRQLYNNTAFAPGSHLAVDGVPGSSSPLLDIQALNEITSIPQFSVNLYVSFPIGVFLGGSIGIYAYNMGISPQFTFVSVGSALDVSPYTTSTFSQKYVNSVNNSYPSSSDFFIAQETVPGSPFISNNVHLAFTARNSRWLFNEIEELPNLEQCSSECTNPYGIVGEWQLCGTSTYRLPGLPRGATISWSVSPSGIATLSGASGNQVTVQKVGAGLVTLQATLTNVCGGNQTISVPIQVGLETPTFEGSVYDGDYVCDGDILEFIVDPFDPAYTYQWSVSSGTIFTGQGNKKIRMYSDGSSSLTVWVRAYDAVCGYSNFFSRNYSFESCDGFWSMSPNPAQSMVTISGTGNKLSETSTTARKSSSQPIYNLKTRIKGIKIYSVTGALIKSLSYNSVAGNIHIDVKDLIKGLYLVEITDTDNKRTMKRLVISR